MSTFKSFFKRIRFHPHQDPARDWLMLVTLSLLGLIGMVVWNVWAFDTVAQGGVIGATTKSVESAVDHTSISAIHAVFEQRASEEAKYVTGVYRYTDPSQ